MKLDKDPMWDIIAKSILLGCVLLSGMYLVTQADTPMVFIGLGLISTCIYQTVNFLSTLTNKNK
jgi:multisubunit Na+/H+ antiporter MnhC subunit